MGRVPSPVAMHRAVEIERHGQVRAHARGVVAQGRGQRGRVRGSDGLVQSVVSGQHGNGVGQLAFAVVDQLAGNLRARLQLGVGALPFPWRKCGPAP